MCVFMKTYARICANVCLNTYVMKYHIIYICYEILLCDAQDMFKV